MHHDTILIVDFGSQVTQLIARRVREAGVFSTIAPFHDAAAAFQRERPKGVIFSGGPASTHAEGSPRAPTEILEAEVPLLGICYGQMVMTDQLGGRAEAGDHREFGRAEVDVIAQSPLTEGVWSPGETHTVWMSHGDRVVEPAPGFKVIARSPGAPFALLANENRRAYGLMFHPEVVHTPDGARLIENFVRRIAGA
ncbi:MAG: glutamine-hydrolyzing GMP synthase, partial [Pseudomonadota bacterium]